jgi:hypothetical protein
MKFQPGFYIMTEASAGQLPPEPIHCPTNEDVTAWFQRAREQKMSFSVTHDGRAAMRKEGSMGNKIIWIESDDGTRVSLAQWVSPP